jgi:pyridoxine 5-phosphate synthase
MHNFALPRLGVNIDHVATLRNARGGDYPDPVAASLLAAEAGADGITAHLREDRRHVHDRDLERLRAEVPLPLNFEMAATPEMLVFALKIKPNAVCLVPEGRQEVTTEGGLDVVKQHALLARIIPTLQQQGIRVSLFIEALPVQIEAAAKVGADIIELYTGKYAHLTGDRATEEAATIASMVRHATALGLECHAGHGLRFDNVGAIAAIPEIMELNIGHYLIAASIFMGLSESVREMKRLIAMARLPA